MYSLILTRFLFFFCPFFVIFETVPPSLIHLLTLIVLTDIMLSCADAGSAGYCFAVSSGILFQSHLFLVISGILQGYSEPSPVQVLGNNWGSISVLVLPRTQWSLKMATCTCSSLNALPVPGILTMFCKALLTCLKQNSTYSATKQNCSFYQGYCILFIIILSNRM